MSNKNITKTLTFLFNNDTKVSFKETFYDYEIPNGEWNAPYPNTTEDSFIFGLLETYGQSDDSWLGLLMRWEGEPNKVIVTD
jgi:hypothetical protein